MRTEQIFSADADAPREPDFKAARQHRESAVMTADKLPLGAPAGGCSWRRIK